MIEPSSTRPLMTIDGRRVASKATFEVVNPATGQVFAEAPDAAPEDVELVFTSARDAQLPWARDEDARRAGLTAIAAALEANLDELGLLLTAEVGRPLGGARAEVEMAAVWARYYAGMDTSPEVVQDDAVGLARIHRRPLGVVAAITPWNYPLSLAMWKVAPALLAGNAVVVKPSPYTPLTTLRFGELVNEILPPGVLSVVSGRDPLGAAITAHPIPAKVAFTGSVATGKKVAAAAAKDLKRVTLELGGNDAAIVLDDVDLDEAIPRLFWASFVNSGQLCCAVKRVYAPRRRYREIVDALADVARSTVLGDGTDPAVELGPLNNEPQLARVAGLVADARAGGARVVAGGRRVEGPGYFYEPAIVADLQDGVALVDEEQFGPALPVIAYDDESDAIRAANNTRLGLNGSVWGSDTDRAAAVAARLNVGTALVNAGSVPEPHLPFGGVGWSGVGRENGRWGYDSFTELQMVYVNRSSPGCS